MSDPIVVIRDLDRGWDVTCGEARMKVVPDGDDLAIVRISGSGNPRSWYLLGARLVNIGRALDWTGVYDSDHPLGASTCGVKVDSAKLYGGRTVILSSGEDEDAELYIKPRGLTEISVRSEDWMDREQMEAAGSILMDLSSALTRGMGFFSLSELRKIISELCDR